MLVSLSIAIGVFSVLIISVISDNGVNLINNELDSLGICGVCITKTSVEIDQQFTNEDLSNIKKQAYVKNATPVITSTGFLNNNTNSLIFLLNKIIYATTHQKRMGILDWYIGTEL